MSSETQWIDTLSILLGLKTCFKEDLGASVTELVYTTFKVPRKFFLIRKNAKRSTNIHRRLPHYYAKITRPIPHYIKGKIP